MERFKRYSLEHDPPFSARRHTLVKIQFLKIQLSPILSFLLRRNDKKGVGSPSRSFGIGTLSLTVLSLEYYYKNPFKSVFSQSESASSAFYIDDYFAWASPSRSFGTKIYNKKIPPQLRNGIQ